MGKSSPSAPAAPDPVATAQAQAAVNKETAITQGQMNQINQYTPYGSLEFAPRGETPEGNPQYSATTTLAPAQQSMLDLTNQAGITYGQTANDQLNAAKAALAQPLDFTSLGAAPVADEATRQATLNNMLARLQPQMDQQRAALDTQLKNQGFVDQGSEGYKTAFDQFNRAQNDARLAADAAAGNQMAQMYGLESAQRNQGINEILQQRQIPLNEVAAMLSGAQVQQPSFVNAPQTQVQSPDLLGATYASYNGQNQQYANQMAQQNAMMGGLFGLGSAGLGAYGMSRLGGGGFFG